MDITMTKLFWLTLSIAMIAARPVVDVEKTVEQVQNILKANAQLPRLTRQEILELLNDIRAEDAKSTSTSSEQTSTEKLTTTTKTPYSTNENEISPTSTVPDLKDNLVPDERDNFVSAASPTKSTVESTTKAEPTLMVVLPYTPRDGSSLQELYTRPPRTEVVALPKTTPKPPKISKNAKLEQTLKDNHDLALANIQDFPAELQAFLDSHGLKSNSGKDHYLLPLDGFKPLPPAKVVDGSVQLPENILLTYDLISPDTVNSSSDTRNQALNNYLYEPLRPELPFELDTSESQKIVLPLDLPKSRKTKSSNSQPQPLLEPLDYDSIKVIPLGQGPSPVEDTKVVLGSDQSKRQTNSTEDSSVEITTSAASDLKEESSVTGNAASSVDVDSGASISDLEDSFGGAAPEMPGDSEIPPPRRNGFYWMVDWNSFLEVGDGDTKVNIRFEPKLGDPQMFLPVSVP